MAHYTTASSPKVKKHTIGHITLEGFVVIVEVLEGDALADPKVHTYTPDSSGAIIAVMPPAKALEYAGLLAAAWKFIESGYSFGEGG